MELHRRRGVPVVGVVFLVLGLYLLSAGAANSSIVRLIAGALFLLASGLHLFDRLKPFRFHIGADGLRLRSAGINGLVPWKAIDAVVLEQPAPSSAKRNPHPRLLLVPTEGADLGVPLQHRSPVDGRACAASLSFDEVKESPEQVAQALAQHGGGRYTDTRASQRFDGPPEFDVVLRGYDQTQVDDLLRRGLEALDSADDQQRSALREEIETRSLPTAMRGYDRYQVDSFLRMLSAQLGNAVS